MDISLLRSHVYKDKGNLKVTFNSECALFLYIIIFNIHYHS